MSRPQDQIGEWEQAAKSLASPRLLCSQSRTPCAALKKTKQNAHNVVHHLYTRSIRRLQATSIFTVCASDALTTGRGMVFSVPSGGCRVPNLYYNVKL
jgi:hypothetical protein